MNKHAYLLILYIFTWVPISLVAQHSEKKEGVQGWIEGLVTTSDNQPAAFVSVALEGTSYGTSTNTTGKFKLSAPAGNYLLVISSIGLQKKKLNVEVLSDKTINLPSVTINESLQQLKEVTVNGSFLFENYKVDHPSSSLRIKTPLLETAQNIQVVTNEVIADQQIFDMLEGVTRNVSGVTRVEHWDNYARINMRGSKIAAFRNGMNVEMPWGPLTEDMSMVERIEFVKGPAGFMLANGEPGGFYNVVTKKPTGTTKGEASLTLGSFDTYRSTLDLDGKFAKNDKLLYRINLMGQFKGSHRDFEFNNRYSIVPVIQYQINDQTTLTAEYTFQYSQMSVIGSGYVFATNGYGNVPISTTTAEPNIDPSEINDHSIQLRFNHRINPHWQLTAQTAYYDYSQEGSSLWPVSLQEDGTILRGLGIWDAANQSKIGQIFVNGEVETGGIQHQILAGLDISSKHYLADWNQSASFTGSTPFNIFDPVHSVPADSIPSFDRSRSLRLRAGGNILSQSYKALYLQDELRLFQNKARFTIAGRFTSLNEAEYGVITEDKKFTPRLGLSISANEHTTIYAVYDQAFVPQAGTDFEQRKFDPITGSNLEAGLKKNWFGGTWNSTISFYQITKNNVLTADPDHVNFSIQLGQTKTKGIEFDVRGEIAKGLNVTLNYAYTDSKISEDTEASIIGNRTPGSTTHISNTWLSYRVQEGIIKGLGISAGYQWQMQRSSWFIWDGSEQSLPDYFRLDGVISWQSKRFNLALNVNNLLNEYLYSGSPYANYFYWQSEPGRNFRLTVRHKF